MYARQTDKDNDTETHITVAQQADERYMNAVTGSWQMQGHSDAAAGAGNKLVTADCVLAALSADALAASLARSGVPPLVPSAKGRT